MRYEIKSIPLWPVIRIAFFVNLIVGFIAGIFMAVSLVPFMALMSAMATYDPTYLDVESSAATTFALTVPFLSALWWAFFGTLFVLIIAFVYNLVARFVGGVECQMEPVIPPASVLVSARPEPTPSAPVVDRPPPPPPVVTQPAPSIPASPPPETEPPPQEQPPDTSQPGDRENPSS